MGKNDIKKQYNFWEEHRVTISGIFLNFVLGVLSYIIPKNKKQILLGSDKGLKFMGNPRYFYLYLLKNKTHFDRIFWITADKKIFLYLKERKYPILYLYSWKAFVAILRSNYLITSHFIGDVSYVGILFGKFNKIETWHGTPIKQIYESMSNRKTLVSKIKFLLMLKERKSYKLLLTTSEEPKKIFETRYKNVRILGYPRNDVFFNSELILEDYGKKFNLNKYDKIILYCPTYRDIPPSKIPFTDNSLLTMNDYLTQNNYLLLIKSHYWKRSNVDIRNYSNIIDVSEKVSDIQDLLIHVDVLITDYSSVAFDFALLDKPIIFYPYDYNEYLENRILYMDYYTDLPGPFAKNEDELFELIQSIDYIFNGTEYKEKYVKFKKRFNYYVDGKSSERLYNYLMNDF
jgi:CDP-glycerol glycerophosphotransferase